MESCAVIPSRRQILNRAVDQLLLSHANRVGKVSPIKVLILGAGM